MKQKILCIDDEQDVLDVIQLYLRELNIEIECFSDPDKAKERIDAEEYAIILSDVRMPNHNGIEFLTSLENISPETMLINMSSHADLEMVLSALQSNKIYDFIKKPLKRDKFIANIQKALSRHAILKEKKSLREQLKQQNEVLEILNKSLDEKVKQRTFELNLRDRLLQHLAGCCYEKNPFEIIHEFCKHLDEKIKCCCYFKDEDFFKLLPESCSTSLTVSNRIEYLSNQNLNQQDLQCSHDLSDIHFIKLTKYSQVIGLFVILYPESLNPKHLKALTNLNALVSLLVYDYATEENQDTLTELLSQSINLD